MNERQSYPLDTCQDRMRQERREALRQMTEEASAAGLYEMSAEDYREALKQARKELLAD